MNTFQLFDLPMELALLIIEQFPAADLAAFVQTSKSARAIALDTLKRYPLDALFDEWDQATLEDNHRDMLLLAPILKHAATDDPLLSYRSLAVACETSCGTAVRVLVGECYYAATEAGMQEVDTLHDIEDTPHLLAMQNSDPAPLEVLVAAGAPLDGVCVYSLMTQPRRAPPHEEEYWLHHAAIAGLEGAASLFLSDKYKSRHDVNRTSICWYTPLILAAENGHEGVVALLLDHGADINLSDLNNRTALSWAAECGFEECVRVLLERGADVHIPDVQSKNALLRAAENGHVEVVRLLLQHGADLKSTDIRMKRALAWAAEGGHAETVRVLLEHGAEADAVDWKGKSALSWAACSQSVSVIQMLLEAGADADRVDKEGDSVIDTAVMQGTHETVRVLMEHGVKLDLGCTKHIVAVLVSTDQGLEAIRRIKEHGFGVDLSDLGDLGVDLSLPDGPLDSSDLPVASVGQGLLMWSAIPLIVAWLVYKGYAF
ncbi:ankyrin repeat-containing domain protein [Aspergillus unguis]